MRSPSHTSWPLTQVEAMRDWNVVPSNGDHAHFDSTSSRPTVNGVSSTSARSAPSPSRRKPRSLVRKHVVEGKSVPTRLGLRGPRTIKKQPKNTQTNAQQSHK